MYGPGRVEGSQQEAKMCRHIRGLMKASVEPAMLSEYQTSSREDPTVVC